MTNVEMIKSNNGWIAETKAPLGINKRDDWKKVDMPLILTIGTGKALNGKLYSHAGVAAEYNGSTIMEICGDYRKILETTEERCTEKTVGAMHQRSLARLPDIIAEAKAFYAAKATEAA